MKRHLLGLCKVFLLCALSGMFLFHFNHAALVEAQDYAEVRLPTYITTHYTEPEDCGDDLRRGDPNDRMREEGYYDPYYGKDPDDSWMNYDKHGHPFDDSIKPAYNSYHNQTTCYNSLYSNPNNVDGVPDELEDFEQDVFDETGYHCDILNYNPHEPVENYLFENHQNIQIVNNIICGNGLFTVIFPPYWTKERSYPVLLKGLGYGSDLLAMYLYSDTYDACRVGRSVSYGEGLIVVLSNTGGRESQGINSNAINNVGNFLNLMSEEFGADIRRVVTEGGSRGGNVALVWGANPAGFDYNPVAIYSGVPPFKIGSMARLSQATFYPFCHVFNKVLGSPGAYRYDYRDDDQDRILTPEEKAGALCRILVGAETKEGADQRSAYGYFARPDLIESLREKRILMTYGTHDALMPIPYLLDFDYLLKEEEIPHKIIIGYCFGHGVIQDNTGDADNTLIKLVQGEDIVPFDESKRIFSMPAALVNNGNGTKRNGQVFITNEVIDSIRATNGYGDYFGLDHDETKLAFSATIPYMVGRGLPMTITLIGEEGKPWEIWCRREDGYERMYYRSGIFGESIDDPDELEYSREHVILHMNAYGEPGRYEWFFSYDGKEIPNRFTPYVSAEGVPAKAVTIIKDTEPFEGEYSHPYLYRAIDCSNFGVDQYHPLLLQGNNAPVLEEIADIDIFAGQTVAINLRATDPDYDELVYDVRFEDNAFIYHDGFKFNGLTGSLIWESNIDDVGEYHLKAIAKDGKGGVAERRFTIRVVRAQYCFQVSPYCDKLFVCIQPNGQITGFAESDLRGQYRVGGWKAGSTWVLFLDMEPAKGHAFEYGLIVGDEAEGKLYLRYPDGREYSPSPLSVNLIDCYTHGCVKALKSLVDERDLYEAGEGDLPDISIGIGERGMVSKMFDFNLAPFCDTLHLDLLPDGLLVGRDDDCGFCDYLVGGYYINNNWVLFLDYLPVGCGHGFGYGIIRGCGLSGNLYRYYPDGTQCCNNPVSITLQSCTSEPSRAKSVAVVPSSIDQEVEGLDDGFIRIPVEIQDAPQGVSTLGFEVTYDSNALEYVTYERGESAATSMEFQIEAGGTGKLIVEGRSQEGGPVQGDLVYLTFKGREPLGYWGEALQVRNLTDDLSEFAATHDAFSISLTAPDSSDEGAQEPARQVVENNGFISLIAGYPSMGLGLPSFGFPFIRSSLNALSSSLIPSHTQMSFGPLAFRMPQLPIASFNMSSYGMPSFGTNPFSSVTFGINPVISVPFPEIGSGLYTDYMPMRYDFLVGY